MSPIADPFVDPLLLPVEVPLKDAPLVRVIAQLRFPEILSVERREAVASFQEGIRLSYPVLRQEQAQSFLLGPDGIAPAKAQTAWRFSDTAGHWRVSLTPNFLALETTKYVSRNDFFGRLELLIQTLAEHISPVQIDRLGVRYIDRITGDALNDIMKLVRAEVRGITGTAAANYAAYTLSETLFHVSGNHVLARWGMLPAGKTFDPSAIEPSTENSWVLDLDMFSGAPMAVDAECVVSEAKRYAERLYTIFRWAVTDDFLARYGG